MFVEVLDHAILPKKGRCNNAEKARQESEIFDQAHRQHSAIKACINKLEVHGLDQCLSYGRAGFERHVGLSIVTTSIHRIGLLLRRKEQARLKRSE